MSEEPEVRAEPVTKVARDLTEILRLHQALLTQAVHKANDPLMPGGTAMVALGNVSNMEAWENHHQATERYIDHPAERRRRAYTSVADEDPDEAWSAFQLIEFWSEAWRAEHSAEYDTRPTITTEAAFLRWSLNWAWDNEPHWDDFARDIRQARLRLEDVVYDGRRVERTRIVCDRAQCAEKPPRLIRIHGIADDMSDDMWKCPGCKHRFDRDELRRAHAKQLRSEGAQKWVHQVDAIGTLKAQGRPERTVRQWLSEGEGSAYCDPVTHEVWVWWPDLWRKHLVTPTRKRATA